MADPQMPSVMGLKDLFRMTEMEKLTLAFDKYINQEPNPQSSFVTSFENQVGIDEDQVGIEDQYTLKDTQKMKLAVKRSEDIYRAMKDNNTFVWLTVVWKNLR
eukprot:g14831.t1